MHQYVICQSTMQYSNFQTSDIWEKHQGGQLAFFRQWRSGSGVMHLVDQGHESWTRTQLPRFNRNLWIWNCLIQKGLNRFGGLLVTLWLETFNGKLRHLMRQRLKNGWTSQQDAAFKIVVSFAHHRHDRGSAWLKVRQFSCFGFILLRKRRAFVLTWGAFCILQPARFLMVFVRFCWI